MTITNENKMIAKKALQAFGGQPKVTKYWDENNVSNIDLLSTIDKPYNGVTPYATIGLSEYSIGYSINEQSLRTEIVGASASVFEYFPNILSTCAFNIMNSNFSIFHGEVFRDAVEMYYPHSDMKHVLFTSPFLWEDLETIDFYDKKVAWLLAVPISFEELSFADKNGEEELENLFEQNDIDIFDLNRASIL